MGQIGYINNLLNSNWLTAYNSMFMQRQPDGNERPLADPKKSEVIVAKNPEEGVTKVTSSESVSYVLLRAAIMNDRETFNNTWSWAQKYLQRKNIKDIYDADSKKWLPFSKFQGRSDNLFAWKFSPAIDGKTDGIGLQEFGFDPAPDADQDIAAALLIANQKWGDENGGIDYYYEARQILTDIWNKETVAIKGRVNGENAEKRVLIGGDTQTGTKDPMNGEPTYGMFPSYFRPSYYTGLFKQYDPSHNWGSLAESSYEIIKAAADAPMHDRDGNLIYNTKHIVPDKIAITQEFNFKVVDHGWHKDDNSANDFYSANDGDRLLFWMAAQHDLSPDDKFAADYCNGAESSSPLQFYKKEVTSHSNTLCSSYRIDGVAQSKFEELYSNAIYKAFFWASGDAESSNSIRLKVGKTSNGSRYYDQNWFWFSNALMDGEFTAALKVEPDKVVRTLEKYSLIGPNVFKRLQLKFQDILSRRAETDEEKLSKGWPQRGYSGRNKDHIKLAEYYMSNDGWNPEKADKAINDVLGQKYASYTKHVPEYHNAVFEKAKLAVKWAKRCIDTKTSKDKEKAFKIFGSALQYLYAGLNGAGTSGNTVVHLAQEDRSKLGSMEYGTKMQYNREILRIAAFAAENGITGLVPDVIVEKAFENCSAGADVWNSDGICIDNFLLIQAYIDYARYQKSRADALTSQAGSLHENKDAEKLYKKAEKTYKTALEYIKVFAGREPDQRTIEGLDNFDDNIFASKTRKAYVDANMIFRRNVLPQIAKLPLLHKLNMNEYDINYLDIYEAKICNNLGQLPGISEEEKQSLSGIQHAILSNKDNMVKTGEMIGSQVDLIKYYVVGTSEFLQ